MTSLEKYLSNPNKCLYCGKDILPNEGQKIANVKEKKFCNSSCAASYNNKKYIKKQKNKRYCLCCKKELQSYQKKYCSNKCQQEYQYNKNIDKWKNNELDNTKTLKVFQFVRKYLLEKYNYKCSKCGWGEINPYTNTVFLEIHHKDGNRENNDEDNLELLCPNCHSLTENYKILNTK